MKLNDLKGIIDASIININCLGKYEIEKYERKNNVAGKEFRNKEGKEMFEKYGNHKVDGIYGDLHFYTINMEISK